MSAGKVIGYGVLAIGVIAVLFAVAVILGGTGGYLIVNMYNFAFGTGVDPALGALGGSIVAVSGGATGIDFHE
ncbi:hypothetical protein [Halorubrum sp. Atlit-26R]|uniref:hypothetical protein n=1 Tax=Halorubrum sp. Atlit-26R TaxID=2282128 RepID=UPI0011C4681E|nr:hypothetical protein [Halorubrum sp. Atlit-26R]